MLAVSHLNFPLCVTHSNADILQINRQTAFMTKFMTCWEKLTLFAVTSAIYRRAGNGISAGANRGAGFPKHATLAVLLTVPPLQVRHENTHQTSFSSSASIRHSWWPSDSEQTTANSARFCVPAWRLSELSRTGMFYKSKYFTIREQVAQEHKQMSSMHHTQIHWLEKQLYVMAESVYKVMCRLLTV